MDLERYERESLREIVENDAYAATFQTVGQYRTALLKHIKNRAAADANRAPDSYRRDRTEYALTTASNLDAN